MTVIPSEVRGWCDLSICINTAIPQDCILLGTVTVCESCLLELSGGIDPHELEIAEEEISKLEGTIDKQRIALEDSNG